MSLINDALKRAKDAQQKAPLVTPGPQLRPAEPAQPTPPVPRPSMMMPIVAIVIVLGGFSLLWLALRKPAPQLPVEAKTLPPANPVRETKPPVQAAVVSTPSPASNSPAAASTPPAAPVNVPAPLKLQAIFFAPGRSSAIISGKTVRSGDSVQGLRVAVISQTSATLVSPTQTNVLTLQEQ